MASRTLKTILLILSVTLATGCMRSVTNNGTSQQNQEPQRNQSGGGTINGGGGKGVRCQKNGLTTVEVLDLYEAKAIYNLVPQDMGNNELKARKQMAQIIARYTYGPTHVEFNAYVDAIEKQFIDVILGKIHFIDPPRSLQLVNDSYDPLLENGCEPVQIATYYDESALLIDRALWNQLDVTNRTALLAHEVLYFLARQAGITNSIGTRKLVGRLLSTSEVRPMNDGMPKGKVFECSMETSAIRQGDFYMLATKAQNGKTNLDVSFQVSPIVNPNFLRTTAMIKDVDLRALLLPKPATYLAFADLNVDSYETLSGQNLTFSFAGYQQGFIYGTLILDRSKTGDAPQKVDFKCSPPDNFNELLEPSGIPAGTYEAPAQPAPDILIVEENGVASLEQTRAFSNGSTSKACRYKQDGIVDKTNGLARILVGHVTAISTDQECLSLLSEMQKTCSERAVQYNLDLNNFKLVK